MPGRSAAFGDDQTLTSEDPAELAGQLDRGGAAVAGRRPQPEDPPARACRPGEVRDQIVRLGSEVLPRSRARPNRPWGVDPAAGDGPH